MSSSDFLQKRTKSLKHTHPPPITIFIIFTLVMYRLPIYVLSIFSIIMMYEFDMFVRGGTLVFRHFEILLSYFNTQ